MSTLPKLVVPVAVLVAVAAWSASSATVQAASANQKSAPANTPGLPFGDMRVVSPAQLEVRPVPSFLPPPFELSAELKKRKITGEATIRFIVSPKGKPEQVEVAQSTHPELGKLAAAYARRLVFKPARLNGAAVACEMEMPFSVK